MKTRSRFAAAWVAVIAPALTVLLGAALAGPPIPEASVTVMTFNVRYDNPADGPNAWPARKELVAKTILFHKADIVGMQECLRGQIADLETLLPGYAWLGVGRDDGKEAGEFNPVFYRQDRFRLLSQATFWLSASPDEAGTRGWDGACNRVVTWARFAGTDEGRPFFVFNTHFDHVGTVARRNSAELLLRRVGTIAGQAPVVVTGDFNAVVGDEPIRILLAGLEGAPPLQDAASLSLTGSYGGKRSFNGFRGGPGPGRVIDFIFVRGAGEVLRHGIIAEKWEGRFASDHYPVLAEISVK